VVVMGADVVPGALAEIGGGTEMDMLGCM
jgi:hypothetical protein